MNVLVVKDEEGILRPQAGIWQDDEYGRESADAYLRRDKKATIVKAELIESL